MPTKTKANPLGCALVRLPEKPSDLIRLALKDLALVERSKIYDVDMGEWHTTRKDEERGVTCMVCFGGAVMSRTFQTPINKYALPEQMPYKAYNWNRLDALNEFREGRIQFGLSSIDRKFSQTYLSSKHKDIFDKVEKLSNLLDYHHDPALFKRSMRKIANLLEEMEL